MGGAVLVCGCDIGFTCSRCIGTPGDWRYHAFPEDVEPFPKSRQLARGQRRYRRKVASAKQWQRIVADKLGPCRACVAPASNGHDFGRVTFHHVVSREDLGDDVADNIVPVHKLCHANVTQRRGVACANLLTSLTDAEYAYMIERGGANYAERAYGIEYAR